MTKSQQRKLLGAIISFIVVALGAWQVSQESTTPASDAVNNDQNSLADSSIGAAPEGYAPFSRVVDGDTIVVAFGGDKYKVRIIGINAPESVDPRKAVECFGLEASAHMKELLNVPYVRLSTDPSQMNKDKYGRWLRYVYTQAGIDVGLQMIKDGYAHEYTYDVPYMHQSVYRSAQLEAQTAKRGLWSADTCHGNP